MCTAHVCVFVCAHVNDVWTEFNENFNGKMVTLFTISPFHNFSNSLSLFEANRIDTLVYEQIKYIQRLLAAWRFDAERERAKKGEKVKANDSV